MELTASHREALLDKLQKVNEKIEINKLCISKTELEIKSEKESGEVVSDGLLAWQETDLFLNEERKKLIEKSLIDNEIDF